ncbi:MAG TPA: hypothetical protein VGO34_14935 [Alphaproteobacteria bacterium]|jgi:hypothetical protein
MLGTFPLATEPLAQVAGPAVQSPAYVELLASQKPGIYLLEIEAYKGGEVVRSGGLAALAEIALADIPRGGGVNVGLITLRYADRDWVGAPDDPAQPNVYYEGRVSVPLVMSRIMPILPEEERRVQRQFGLTEIINADGALDQMQRGYAIDGRRLRVLFGPVGGRYADFSVIADVIATGWTGDEAKAQLGLRDRAFSLDLPLQTNLFAGSGGAEGTAEIQGKPKPLAFGIAPNVTPVLIDPAHLIYQVHDGALQAVDAVFDRGAELVASGVDVASFAALVAQSVPAGQFATAKAVGLFKLGDMPTGLVTADVRGDVTPFYADTLDTICLRILKVRAGLPAQFLNQASFAGPAALGGALGIYLPHTEAPTTAQVVDRLIGSVGGWWGAARDGRIRAGRLSAPESRAPTLFLDQNSILSLEPVEAPVPRWRQRVSYRPNWTEQRGEDLADVVTAARRQFLTESSRAVSSASVAVKSRHLQALDPDPLASLYYDADDAQRLADFLLALHSPDRRMFNVTVKRIGYQADYQTVTRITWPRYALQNGQNFAVVGINDQSDREETILTVWG